VPTKSPVRVLLVGDRPVVVAGLAGIVDTDPILRVVGEARNASEALKKLRDTEAEILITCTPLADGSSPALVRRVKSTQPSVAVVAMTLLDDAKLAEEMIRAGATSCIAPDADRRTVIDAVRAAVGKPRPLRRPDGMASTAPPNSPLSRRELQVLTLIAEGNTNKQVAELLGISVRTVETHRERVMRKLNAQGTAALTKWAISLGLVNPRG
jgi:DNA-binding NarL/FixJ family response regulator